MNRNPWLKIPLRDYEAHMSLDSVGQAQFLAETLGRVATEVRACSVAVIGCSGGNGFENLRSAVVRRVVGVDINPEYVEEARQRFHGCFEKLELLCDDFQSHSCAFQPVDLVSAGLLFEYVDVGRGLAAIKRFVSGEGYLSVVLQLPSDEIAKVSPSPYHSLKLLEQTINLVVPAQFCARAISLGFTVMTDERRTLASGKQFQEFLFQYLPKSVGIST